jgi:FKBP-type peptidyl-prolyl cis-trans isomerase
MKPVISPPCAALALLAALSLACSGDRQVEEREVGAATLHAQTLEASAPRTEQRGDGLVVEVHAPGQGASVTAQDSVRVHYTAFLPGSEKPFASTRASGAPLVVHLASGRPRVIEGLRRGLVGLRPGARVTLRIPAALAWGADGIPSSGVPADADVVFEVDVLALEPG